MRRKIGKKKQRCPVDNKVTYRDEHSARRAIRNAKEYYGHSDKTPKRTYYCEDAKGWHLTSTDDVSGFFAEREVGRYER